MYLILLAVAVLRPHSSPPADEVRALFGNGSLADGIRNLVLFAPLGAGLVASGRSVRAAIALSMGLSLAIELTQLIIPGRIASPIDLLSNTLGASLGAYLAIYCGDLMRPTPRMGVRLSLGATALSTGLILTAAWLLQPVYPSTTYYGGWTLDLGHMTHYAGRVSAARVGPIELEAGGPVLDSIALRRELSRGSPIRVRAIAGTPPVGLAPLVTIHDEAQREILLLGINGHDLVFRRYLRATEFGFETPAQAVFGALDGLSTGDTFDLTLNADDRGHVLRIANQEPSPIHWTPGHTWALLSPLSPLPRPLARVLDASWMALLVFPAAYWARRRVACWLALALGLGVIAVSFAIGNLGPLPGWEWAGASLGAAAGLLGAKRSARSIESAVSPKES